MILYKQVVIVFIKINKYIFNTVVAQALYTSQTDIYISEDLHLYVDEEIGCVIYIHN